MLVLAGFITLMAVAWTGWRAIRDLDHLEHQVHADAEPVVSPPRLRLIEATALTGS